MILTREGRTNGELISPGISGFPQEVQQDETLAAKPVVEENVAFPILIGRLEGLDPKGADLVVVAGDFGIMNGWGAWHLYGQVDWVNTHLAE